MDHPPRTRSPLPVAFSIALALALVFSLGCEMDRRVISVRGGLSGIEGAQGQELAESQRVARPRSGAFAELASQQREQASLDTENTNPRSLRITQPDGQTTLIMTSPRHVVLHLRQTLLQDEPELLFEQVLSDRAKKAYIEQGLDPHDAVDFLFEHRREILTMLQRMPQGELSPGMYLNKIGPSAYRLELSGASGQGLKFRRLDIVWERGICRLLAVG